MKKIYIAIRLPGFYAGIEKQMLPGAKDCPLVVTQGEDHRSTILSVCKNAREEGLRPGMRIGDIKNEQTIIIKVHPEKYQSEIKEMEERILQEIPNVEYLRPGLFMALWEGKGRFLDGYLKRLLDEIKKTEYSYAVGIAEEPGLAELAAMSAAENELKKVEEEDIQEFLKNTPVDLVYDIRVTG